METLDERLERIEREAEDMPRLDLLSNQALRLLLAEHVSNFCQLGREITSQSFFEISDQIQSKHGILGMLLRECEVRRRNTL